MRSSLSGGALGRLVILLFAASLLWACGKYEPRCVAGTAGCECAHPQACDEGLECRWDICYGGEVTPPDTYFYTDRSLQDYDDTKRLIQRYLDLSPGDHVADIGCGKGSMTVAMSRLIGPTGKAYATDIDPSALTRTRENLQANTNAKYSPLETFLAKSPRDTGLESVPDGTLRVMLMINSVFFERDEDQADAAEYMGRFLKKLAPGGRLIYHFDWIEPQRLTFEETTRLMLKAGFSEEVGEIPMLPHIPEETYVVSGSIANAVPKPLKRGFIGVYTRPGGPKQGAQEAPQPKPPTSSQSKVQKRPPMTPSKDAKPLTMGTMVKQFVGANRIPANHSPDVPFPRALAPECTRGEAGCRCRDGRECDPGLSCRWESCWGGDVQPPDTYYYSDRSEADVAAVRKLISDHMSLGQGDRVVDVGCGTGILTREAARRVGATGKVYATDIAQAALDALPERLKVLGDKGLSPIERRLAESTRHTGLDSVNDASIQLILMINSAQFQRGERREEAVSYLSRFLAKLAPGGRLIYHYDWLDPERLSRAEHEALFASAGFAPKVVEIPMPAHIPAETFALRGGGTAQDKVQLTRGFILVFERPAADAGSGTGGR